MKLPRLPGRRGPTDEGIARSKPGRVVVGTTIYRGNTGQWAFILHRITGFLLFIFLMLHILDVALVRWPGLYEDVHKLYGAILLRLFEVGLLAALLYHSLNGLRIIMVDFFPNAVRREREMFLAVCGVTLLGTAVGGYIIVLPFLRGTLGLPL